MPTFIIYLYTEYYKDSFTLTNIDCYSHQPFILPDF